MPRREPVAENIGGRSFCLVREDCRSTYLMFRVSTSVLLYNDNHDNINDTNTHSDSSHETVTGKGPPSMYWELVVICRRDSNPKEDRPRT